MYKNYITDIEGIMVGHCDNQEAMTGCTVILTPEGATAGVDVRGSAPGTRETDLLNPMNLVDKVHGILLSGGSAYGLDAASGVMEFLEEQNKGFDVGNAVVPIIPAAVLFDLHIGNPKIRPDKRMGYQAALNASYEEKRIGLLGAGTGATAGKILGIENSSRTGLSSSSIVLDNGIKVAALVALNPFGDVIHPKTQEIVAGAKHPATGKFINTYDTMKHGIDTLGFSGQNTTIAVVATNVKLNKSQSNKVAQMAHNGLARTINPIHTMVDGDTIFALSYGEVEGDVNLIGSMAAEALELAVLRLFSNKEEEL